MRDICITVLLLCFGQTLMGQEKCPVHFGKVTAEDFNVSSPLINSGSNAVIIADVGDVSFVGNTHAWFSYVFRRTVRIKLLTKKAFRLASVAIELNNHDEFSEKVDDIKASSFTADNGTIREAAMDKKDIFEERIDKNKVVKKFTVPGAKEGAIIEYTYTITSDFEQLPSWIFQSEDGPTLWSELNAEIPGVLFYQFYPQSYFPFLENTKKEGYKRYAYGTTAEDAAVGALRAEAHLSASLPTSIMRWVKKDLPSFTTESYIYSPFNYIDKLSSQLVRIDNGRGLMNRLGDWSETVKMLNRNTYFGKTLDASSPAIRKTLDEIIAATDNGKIGIARKIYNYLTKNFTCTNTHNIWLTSTLDDVIKKKSGTVGDINLLLTAMLRQENIVAFPVVMSTREAGRNWRYFPLLEKIDYVVCMAKIDSSNYYLDATFPFLPFGELPARCYNGYARVATWDTTEINLSPNTLKNEAQVFNYISNANSVVSGNRRYLPGHLESQEIRLNISGSSPDNYRQQIQKSFSDNIQPDSTHIDNVNVPENDVAVESWFRIPGFGKDDMVYFNPMMGSELQKNPFAAAERLYPVEMPYASDYLYTLNMEIPAGYEIESLPVSSRVALNEKDGGVFEYLFSQEDGVIYFKCHLSLKKAFFPSDDYQALRDFYDYILKKESEQIVFKKKK